MKKTLHMDGKTSFWELQNAFVAEYAFLRLEFCKPIRNKVGMVIRSEKINGIENIETYLTTPSSKTVDITYNKTITEVIAEIEDYLNVTVSIQRKSGRLWIATSLTTGWTLEHQNSEGKFLSQEFIVS